MPCERKQWYAIVLGIQLGVAHNASPVILLADVNMLSENEIKAHIDLSLTS